MKKKYRKSTVSQHGEIHERPRIGIVTWSGAFQVERIICDLLRNSRRYFSNKYRENIQPTEYPTWILKTSVWIFRISSIFIYFIYSIAYFWNLYISCEFRNKNSWKDSYKSDKLRYSNIHLPYCCTKSFCEYNNIDWIERSAIFDLSSLIIFLYELYILFPTWKLNSDYLSVLKHNVFSLNDPRIRIDCRFNFWR